MSNLEQRYTAPSINDDERCDLFVLDGDANVNCKPHLPSESSSSSASGSDNRGRKRRSSGTVIPYVPKPVKEQPSVEYVPGGGGRVVLLPKEAIATAVATTTSKASPLVCIESSNPLCKKARIAHTPSYDVSTVNRSIPARIKATGRADLWQTVMNRYEQNSAPRSTPITGKRVAHLPQGAKGQTASAVVMPLPVLNTKINLGTRRSVLSKLIFELSANADKSDQEEMNRLVDEAKRIENDLCVRSKNIKNIYLSLGASKVQSIRKGQTQKVEEAKAHKSQPTTTASSSTGSMLHNAIINAGLTNCSIVKRPKVSIQSQPIDWLLRKLDKLTIPVDMLPAYGFPMPQPTDPTVASFPNKPQPRQAYREGMLMICSRCRQQYRNPQPPSSDPCVYHGGRIYKSRDKQGVEGHYTCCSGDFEALGCNSAPFHVNDGNEFHDTRQGFRSTASSPLAKDTGVVSVFALDCEMCFTEVALELTRVTVLDFDGNVVYDTLVKPTTKILDYNTQFSGIKEGDLDEVTTTLADVQQRLLEIINARSIVIGHGLDSDFRALKLFHQRVVDTTNLYPHRRGLPFKRSLATLASSLLNKIIQNGVQGGHDSNEDAKAALDLVKMKLQEELNKEQQVASKK